MLFGESAGAGAGTHLVQVEERLPVSLPVLELEQGQERASG